MATLAAGSDGNGADARAELDHRDEAVAARPVPALRTRIRPRAERGQGAPAGGGEADRNARAGIAERLDDVAGQALEAGDLAPGRAPASELALQPGRGGGERLQLFRGRRGVDPVVG